MGTVAIKNINEKLYRKLKALAALTGINVGEAVNEALQLWVKLAASGVSIADWISLEKEAAKDDELYEKEEARLLADHPGEYVSIVGGRLLGTFAKLEDALKASAAAKEKHGIVTRIEQKPKKTIELGWSILEQLA